MVECGKVVIALQLLLFLLLQL